jgi:RIO kinase 1
MALRQSKKKRPRREVKQDKQQWPLEEGVFDRTSLLVLEKFMKKDIFRTIDHCIARGKEANVYRGTDTKGNHVAIKMYRLRSPSFQNMQDYIQGDRRFERGLNSKKDIIFTWTQKEFSNLKLMDEFGVHVPKPIAFKCNVLAMEFLGENGQPYPTLADVGTEDVKKTRKYILDDIKKIGEAGLVHADLSEYNILMGSKRPYIIDVGQSVLKNHPKADEFYARDIYNIDKYFKKYPPLKY